MAARKRRGPKRKAAKKRSKKLTAVVTRLRGGKNAVWQAKNGTKNRNGTTVYGAGKTADRAIKDLGVQISRQKARG